MGSCGVACCSSMQTHWLSIMCSMVHVCACVCGVSALQIELVQPHGNLLCKSGTDFKNVTAIEVTMPEAAAADGDSTTANGSSSQPANGAAAAAGRPSFSWQEHAMTSDVPEDPDIKQVGAGGQLWHCYAGMLVCSLTGSSNEVWRCCCTSSLVTTNKLMVFACQVHQLDPST